MASSAFVGSASAQDVDDHVHAGEEAHDVRVSVVDSDTGEPVPVGHFGLSIDGGLIPWDEDPCKEKGTVLIRLVDGEYELRAGAYPEWMHGLAPLTVEGEATEITIGVPPGPNYDERDELEPYDPWADDDDSNSDA